MLFVAQPMYTPFGINTILIKNWLNRFVQKSYHKRKIDLKYANHVYYGILKKQYPNDVVLIN